MRFEYVRLVWLNLMFYVLYAKERWLQFYTFRNAHLTKHRTWKREYYSLYIFIINMPQCNNTKRDLNEV